MDRWGSIQISNRILGLIQGIGVEVGAIEFSRHDNEDIIPCSDNMALMVHSSLAIEGNSLSLGDVQNLYEGNLVGGKNKDIRNAQSGLRIYKNLRSWDVFSEESFLEAGSFFMDTDVLQYRPGVAEAMRDLFEFIGKSRMPWVFKACIFHYELMRIEPFEEGNGRMARLWQQLLLMCDSSIFQYVPVDQAIGQYQDKYYGQMAESFSSGDLVKFLELALDVILFTLVYHVPRKGNVLASYEERMKAGVKVFEGMWFTRKEYEVMLGTSLTTAGRDLRMATKTGRVIRKGSFIHTKYRY